MLRDPTGGAPAWRAHEPPPPCRAVETAATRAPSPPAWAPRPTASEAGGVAAGRLGAFCCREFIRRVSGTVRFMGRLSKHGGGNTLPGPDSAGV